MSVDQKDSPKYKVGDKVIPTKESAFIPTPCNVIKVYSRDEGEDWDYTIKYDDQTWGELDVYESEIRPLTKLEQILK
jgi:hypothetical protein